MNTDHGRRTFLTGAAMLVATASLAKTAPTISTVIGTGQPGMAADGETAATAKLNNPFGVVIGPDKALYWADFAGNRVLKLDLVQPARFRDRRHRRKRPRRRWRAQQRGRS